LTFHQFLQSIKTLLVKSNVCNDTGKKKANANRTSTKSRYNNHRQNIFTKPQRLTSHGIDSTLKLCMHEFLELDVHVLELTSDDGETRTLQRLKGFFDRFELMSNAADRKEVGEGELKPLRKNLGDGGIKGFQLSLQITEKKAD